MLAALKRSMGELSRGTPGRRFQQRYERAQQLEPRGGIRRAINYVVAVGAFSIGVVLVFIPGPAVVFFVLAGALLAPESRAVARVMDWAEVKVRAIWQWAGGRWRSLSQAGKIAAASLGALAGAAGALTFWHLLRS